MPTVNIKDIPESKIVKFVDLSEDSVNKISDAIVQKIAEPTEEQVKEYCRKRCLAIVDSGLFNEMKVNHGYWIEHAMSIKDVPTEACSECGEWSYGCDEPYCPHCGAKMDAQET